MTSGPTSQDYFGNNLHNQPGVYWCADCHRFTLDCSHLVEPLNAPSVILSNWLIQSVTYEGAQRILELEMNTGERFQHFGVPRRIAIALVQADDPTKYMNHSIEGTYQCRRVRGQRFRTGEMK
jgi:KTSC domain